MLRQYIEMQNTDMPPDMNTYMHPDIPHTNIEGQVSLIMNHTDIQLEAREY